MAEITAKRVGELRAKTGAGLMDCKRALTESDGDFDIAVDNLRKKGVAIAAKRAGRDASVGIVETYIHTGGKVGVMVGLFTHMQTHVVKEVVGPTRFVINTATAMQSHTPMQNGCYYEHNKALPDDMRMWMCKMQAKRATHLDSDGRLLEERGRQAVVSHITAVTHVVDMGNSHTAHALMCAGIEFKCGSVFC